MLGGGLRSSTDGSRGVGLSRGLAFGEVASGDDLLLPCRTVQVGDSPLFIRWISSSRLSGRPSFVVIAKSLESCGLDSPLSFEFWYMFLEKGVLASQDRSPSSDSESPSRLSWKIGIAERAGGRRCHNPISLSGHDGREWSKGWRGFMM